MEMFIDMHKCGATVELVDGIAFPERGLFASSMGHSDKNKKLTTKTTEMENLSLDISRTSFSRDLLQRFMGSSSSASKEHEHAVRAEEEEEEEEEEEDEEIELNLGLSLGGRFGVDKSSSKLVRSSSIASCLPVVKDDNDASTVPPPPVAYSGLRRTSSLPVETEEEWRKRKELQTLRRMEAKRRRSEKQRNLRAESGVNRSGSLSLEERKEIEVNLRERLEREKAMSGALKRLNSSHYVPVNLPTSHGGGDAEMAKGKGTYVGSSGGVMKGFASQGSIESKGGSSSSDLGSKTLQGSSGELSPASIQSITPRTEKESPSKKTDPSKTRARETGTTSSNEDMPSVFTRGDGPNGKRVDGILYKYGKGVEVRIMCVCHGTFHSPAEFIRHAGGTDVDNPLKHIVINSNSSAML